MKKQNLIILLAALGLGLAGCNNQPQPTPSSSTEPTPTSSTEPTPTSSTEPEPSSSAQPEPSIVHQDPFVTTVTDPSNVRNFREEFDTMIEDFSGETPSGTTTGVFNKSFLRVLVDSEDEGEPTSPDGAIYKMATGNYEIQNYDGIGFRMRIVGSGQLKLSNLVLGLRGDDAFKVFPIQLSEALDPDGEALPTLTNEFKDVIVSPGQSIEDANTVYQLLDGGDSTTKVLDKILGFHLYALDEECSAVVEIEEVYLVNAGEKTSLDAFGRAKVNQTDPTCWWRDSTGFIVQKGVTLDNKQYTTKDIELGEYKNLVINVLGDTSELKINNVAYSRLKDDDDNALTGAVNGAFYSYVINLEKSSLALNEGKFVIESGKNVVISQLFLTNLQNEMPAENYPYIDTLGASYATKFDFTVAKGTAKDNYDDAVLDTRVTDSGLNYLITYHGGENVAVDGGDLVISGGDYDYTQVVIGSNAVANKKFVVFAMKTDEKPSGFRFQLGGGATSVTWLNDLVADAGLPSWSDATNYPYVTEDGYKLVIVDLARNNQAGGNNEIIMYYTGTADLKIGSIFFTDAYKPEARAEEGEALAETTINAGTAYQYVGYAYMPADIKYAHVTTTATVANQIRFEGNDGAKWLKDGVIIDIDGHVVEDGDTDYVIDLVASGLKAAGVEQGIHVHSTQAEEAATIEVKTYKVIPAVEAKVTEVFNKEIAAKEPAAYAYVEGFDMPADLKYVKIETNAAVANELRFEGNDGAKWLKDGDIIDINGEVVEDGSTEYVIDLVASGLKADGVAGALHTHSTTGASAFNVKLSKYELVPVTHQIDGAKIIDASFEAGTGYQYVGGADLAANVKYVKVNSTAAVANQIRFEGNGATKWLKDNDVIDANGEVVVDGSSEYVIDLEATGIKAAGTATTLHVHSTLADAFDIKLTIVYRVADGSYEHLLLAYNG